MAAWDVQRAEALAEGLAILETESRIEQLTEIVIDHLPHLEGVYETDGSGTQTYRLAGIEQIAADLRIKGSNDWADWFDERGYGPVPSTLPHFIATDLLIGRAAGRYFVRHPTLTSLALTSDVLAAFKDGWRAFTPAATNWLAMYPSAKTDLNTFLQEQVEFFTWAPRRMASVVGANTCGMVRDFNERPRLSEVWQEHPYMGGFMIKCPMAFDILRRCDPEAFLTLIDAFPHPEPGRQIMAT